MLNSGPQPLTVATELGRHHTRVLALGSIGMFMGTLITTAVAVALPVMGPELHLSYSEALWVQAAYLLTTCVILIPVGRVADRLGLLRFYLSGVAVFAVSSVACALAVSGPSLIAARGLQGVGAAFMSATAPALVATVFPPEKRGRALGMNVMAGYVGLMVGSPIGGLIVGHIGWRWIFVVNIPLALITLVNGWYLLGAERRDRAAAEVATSLPAEGLEATTGGRRSAIRRLGSLDWSGTALLALLLLALLVPLISVPLWGWLSPLTLALLGSFVVLLAAFVIVEDRVRDPLVNLDLVRKNRVFATGASAAFLNYAAVFGVATLTAVYLQIRQGYSPQQVGLVLLIQPVFTAGLSPVFGRLSDRIGSRVPMVVGMLLVAAGTIQLGLLPFPSPVWRVLLALCAIGAGMAAFMAPNTSAVMGSMKRTQLSLASSFLGTMRTAGQGVSIALLGGIAASDLGPTGGKVLFLGEKAGAAAAETFAHGYRTAMFVAAGLAFAGALVSLVQSSRPGGYGRAGGGG